MNRDNKIQKEVSIVIPVYNEEKILPAMYDRLEDVMVKSGYTYELIFVDDGSQDQSFEILKNIKQSTKGENRIKIVKLSRNFGQHPALSAGFSIASGKTIITIDTDLQIDPGYIPEILREIKNGYEFVSGIRRGSGDSYLFRRFPSKILNAIIGSVTGKKLSDYGCPLNGMKAEIAEKMTKYGDMQRFFKPLAILLADSVTEVPVRHNHRKVGSSKYGFLDLVDLFFDFITNFSRRLFQRIAIIGIVISGFFAISALTYLTLRFPLRLVHDPLPWLLTILLIGFIFGLQIFIMGLLGDFIIRIYKRIDSKPIFEIERIL